MPGAPSLAFETRETKTSTLETHVPTSLARFAASLILIAPMSALTQPPPTPPLAGIAHAAISVANLDASRAFYHKLGFEEAFAFDKNGVTTQSFIKINDRQFIELYPRLQPSDTAGFLHVCFESADVAALNKFYLARGLKPHPVGKAAAGNLLFTMEGPEHQNIEYTQYLPGSRHSNDLGKHLGPNRISTALVATAVFMQDPAAAQVFYSTQLGFPAAERLAPNIGFEPDSIRWLQLPGSTQSIAFIPQGSAFRMIFAVDDLKQTTARLQALNIPFIKTGATLNIHDPDGNILVFAVPPLFHP
jgi:catechol 2,3-dioxygenase-like lactoylglutathione lyase family enzyme